MAAIVPLRGTYTAKVVVLENCPGYAIINSGSGALYIRNETTDSNADSTTVISGASFASTSNFPYLQAGYKKVVIDGTATTFSLEALPGPAPTVTP